MNRPNRRRLRDLARETRGASIAEYLIVIGVVGLGAVAAFKAFGSKVFGASGAQGDTVVCVADGQSGCAGAAPALPPGPVAPPALPPGPVASNDSPSCTGTSCPPGSGNCFVEGTLIATPSGDTPIEQLRTGDLVLSRDPATGVVAPEAVLETYVRLAPSLVDLRVADPAGAEDTLRATPEHRFWTLDRGWTEAGALLPGEPLLDVEGRELSVVSVTPLALEDMVYNFEVDQTHTYFVGRSHTLVHNPDYQQVWNPSTGQWEYPPIGQGGPGSSPGPYNTPLPASPYMGNTRPQTQAEYDQTHNELLHSGRVLVGYHGSGTNGYNALANGSPPRSSQFPDAPMWNGVYTSPHPTYSNEYGYDYPFNETTMKNEPGGTLGVYARPTSGYYFGGDLKNGANAYGQGAPWANGRPYSLTGPDGTDGENNNETVNSQLQDPVFVPVSQTDRYGSPSQPFTPYQPIGHPQFGGNPNPGFGRPPPNYRQ